jgi:curved DNA-binding protein CbpA
MFEEAAKGVDLTKKEQLLIEQLFFALPNSSHYGLLGVQSDASNKQIRDAYYELSRHWHPDRFFRRNVGDFGSQIEAIFTAVTAAYQTLSNETKRKNYDRKLNKEQKTQKTQKIQKTGPNLKSPTGQNSRPGRPRRVNIVDPTFSAPSNHIATQSEYNERVKAEADQQRNDDAAARAWKVLSQNRRFDRNPGRTRYRNRVLSQIRNGGQENIRRARVYFEAGCTSLEEGNPLKAESSLYLAVKLAPENPSYHDEFKRAQVLAREARAKQFINAAESAEQYQNAQEALYNYRRAAEYQTSESKVYFRLSRLIRIIEKDEREAVKVLRIAIEKSPGNPDYRIALAELYAHQGLQLNARRELQKAIKIAKEKGMKETRARAQAELSALS